MSDIADAVGTLEQCLYSIGQRVKIAQFLLRIGQEELLPTILEDIFYSVEIMTETYCVKEDPNA